MGSLHSQHHLLANLPPTRRRMAAMKAPFPARLFATLLLSAVVTRAEVVESDIVIFGGTPGGVAAAVQARRMGKTAVIAEWTPHLGGLTTGGLGATDIGN